MKALSGGRPSQLQITSAHTCGLADCEHSLDHHDSRTPSYLLSPTESCPMEHRRCSPHSSIHSECMAMPVSVSMANTDHSISSSTFPRMHYSSHHDGSGSRDSGGGGGGGGGGSRDRDECGSSHGGSGKMNRIPANLLDQFEKQLPLHRDGFHTLQYQKTHTTTTEQRNESPGRIRHLVHSVQKLFTKSHSLEGSSKMNGTKGDSHREGSHHHHPNHHGHHKHSKRSKSKERKSSDSSGKQRSGVAGWWSSDDNLDSDSTYRTPSVMSRQQVDHISHCYPDSVHSHYGNLSLKTSKSNNDVKCSACESVAMAPEGKFMKRSSWSTLTVSQAKEAYRKSSLNLEKPMTPTDLKPNLRPCHYLQVPQDEWSGYPGGGKDDEIPCRRMRSSSYVKAMGDDESGESDSSPKTSPVKTVRPDALVKSVMQRPLLDSQSSYRVDKMNSDVRNYITNFAADLSHNYHLQASRDPHHPSMALEPSTNYNSQQPPLPAAQFRSRNQSYMRAVSTLSQASCVSQVSQVSETDINGQFESVCESVFSEVESQAVEALDLPGCFRTRSHSYLRAIQAGYSQDDDCIPTMTSSTVTSTIRSTTGIQFRLPSTCTIDRTTHETPAVTYTNNYKKTTPPPVPPRSTSGSKPLISVTAQSSTESTQDTYHEGRHPRGWGDGLGLSLGRALYNSTDSLDSAKAVTIAMEAAGLRSGKRHPSTDRHSHSSVVTCDKAILVSKAEEYLKTPRSSIGIQVEAATDSESESKGSKEYHSVGIQVEADRRVQGRLKRSNSVTASVQADMEMEGFPTMEDKGLQFGGGFLGGHSEPSTPTQYGVRTVRTQGLFSYREDYRTPTEPPCPQQTSNETTWQLEPPSPREPAELSGESCRTSPALRRDGSWFMQLLHAETKRMEGCCKEMEAEAEENDLSEDILGKIRSAVGSAQLLMSQKFQQFYWLCQQNLDPSAMPRPTSQDLAGFWDLLQLSIDDVTTKFDELQQIKNNDWRPVEKSPEKRVGSAQLPPVAPKKSMIGKRGVTREKSLDLPDRHRLEARRRLMQAKRAASFRQNSVSERADSIEIYIPEAQTRL
ncbi:disks large-associated protein 2-like isoform X2 [Salvelinus fontinalis]|uniref:disks large-associated protein 2-like isoform X2 n=1 Tax=Salvelinus fontinalis TaxID=8038 RepID=UPI002486A4E7|nr:disks large-associated protein 2-like isoform X2 [Salvelinus fontinalis]